MKARRRRLSRPDRQIRKTPRPARGRSCLGASSTSSATTSWRTRPKISPAGAGTRGAPSLRLLRHVPGGGEERRRRGHRAALQAMTRRRVVAIPPMDARSGRRCIGSPQPTPCRRKSGFTIRSSPAPIPAPRATSWRTSTRTRSKP